MVFTFLLLDGFRAADLALVLAASLERLLQIPKASNLRERQVQSTLLETATTEVPLGGFFQTTVYLSLVTILGRFRYVGQRLQQRTRRNAPSNMKTSAGLRTWKLYTGKGKRLEALAFPFLEPGW